MSDAQLVVIAGAGLVALALVLLAVRSPAAFSEFFLNITSVEFSLKGIRLSRAVKDVREAEREKRGEEPPATLTETLKRLGRRAPARLLWIDDNPPNNEREASAFRNLRLDVDQVTTNAAAARALAAHTYDLVISDIRRAEEGPEAGLDVPELVRASHAGDVPILYYVGEATAGVTADGHVVTTRPSDLFAQAERLLRR